MERYKIQIKPSASKELGLVGSKKDRQRIVSRIYRLADDPRPIGCEKLAAEEDKSESGKGTIESVIRSMIDSSWLSLSRSVIAERFTDKR